MSLLVYDYDFEYTGLILTVYVIYDEIAIDTMFENGVQSSYSPPLDYASSVTMLWINWNDL